jgi:hypothetical protein
MKNGSKIEIGLGRVFGVGDSVEVGAKKSGKSSIAPLNHLPLLPSGPGGVQQELAVPICRCKDIKPFLWGKLF